MEDKHQLAGQQKLAPNDERGTESGVCGPGGHPITRPSARSLPASDRRVPRFHDCSECRECLAALSHRLAQPMTALRGGMELILMGKRTVADYQALIEQSLRLADDMSRLIVSLRDLGESGAPSGTTQCIQLQETAAEVLAEMESLAQARELHLQLASDTAVNVSANLERLREALQSLLAWVIQSSAGSGVITLELSTSEAEAYLLMTPPRLDLQYLQIKVLENITTPGLLFSHAAKNGSLGWAINQRLMEGLGGKLEILTDGPEGGCIRVRLPLVLHAEVEKPS